MRLLKLSDLVIQGILLSGGLIYAFQYGDEGRFLGAYYSLGSWQLLSFVIHATSQKNLFFRKERMAYGKTILWLLVIGAFGLLLLFLETPIILFYLFALLVVSPCLGIWYFTICFREVQLMNKKALGHFK
jgi:hypothetical protein